MVGMVPAIAQTNTQLYRQLTDAGFAQPDLVRIRDAYELAAELFTGRFRNSHRPFLAHVVGTASLVAVADGRPTMVAAALVHAAYTRGDWGPGTPPTSPEAREAVRDRVGTEVEALVHTYAEIPGRHRGEAEWAAGMVRAGSSQALDVIVLRLANDIDELQDQRADREPPRIIPVLADAAVKLGGAEVSGRLMAAFDATRALAVPPALRLEPYPRNILLPRSARVAWRVRVRRAIRRPTLRGIARRLTRRS
jgi:hypothetical protein